MKLVPAIDLKDGKCVRLLRGDFDETTEYSDDPAAVARQFTALAVDDLHIVDLDGARSGTQRNRSLVSEIAAQSNLTVQLGGGIRTRDEVATWLAAGVSRCVIGSVAISDPATVKRWLEEFGADAIVLALDVRLNEADVPLLTTHGWTQESGITLWECMDGYRDAGASHILCTDVARDGAMAGPNADLYAEVLSRYPNVQLQASGGIRHLADLEALRALGVPSAISGRALLDGAITAVEVAAFQQSA